MLHTWQKSYNLRRNEENLAAKLLNISGEILTAKLKDLGANLIIDLTRIRPTDSLILPFLQPPFFIDKKCPNNKLPHLPLPFAILGKSRKVQKSLEMAIFDFYRQIEVLRFYDISPCISPDSWAYFPQPIHPVRYKSSYFQLLRVTIQTQLAISWCINESCNRSG